MYIYIMEFSLKYFNSLRFSKDLIFILFRKNLKLKYIKCVLQPKILSGG